jgi:hypothetical protein
MNELINALRDVFALPSWTAIGGCKTVTHIHDVWHKPPGAPEITDADYPLLSFDTGEVAITGRNGDGYVFHGQARGGKAFIAILDRPRNTDTTNKNVDDRTGALIELATKHLENERAFLKSKGMQNLKVKSIAPVSGVIGNQVFVMGFMLALESDYDWSAGTVNTLTSTY